MASDVLHTFIPAAITFKDSATEATGASLRGLTFFDPATTSDILEAVFEESPILGIGITGGEWDRARTGLGFVHSSMMLGEEILSVEVIVDTFVAGDIGV